MKAPNQKPPSLPDFPEALERRLRAALVLPDSLLSCQVDQATRSTPVRSFLELALALENLAIKIINKLKDKHQ